MQNSLNYGHSKIFVAVMVIFVLQGKKQFHNKQMKVKKKKNSTLYNYMIIILDRPD